MKEFDLERAKALAEQVDASDAFHKIGTYNERSQHRTLKFIIEEDKQYHEVPVDAFIADICRDGHIYEIQTAGFGNLVSKLRAFTKDYHVTIVYPAAVLKTVIWIDPDTGESKQGRRFSKKSSRSKLLSELIHIHEYFSRGLVDIMLIETEVNDYRVLDGRGKDRKIKATKADTVPVSILNSVFLETPEDVVNLLPLDVNEEYTRVVLGKILGLAGRNLSNAIKAMLLLGLIEKSKVDNKKIYYKRRAFG